VTSSRSARAAQRHPVKNRHPARLWPEDEGDLVGTRAWGGGEGGGRVTVSPPPGTSGAGSATLGFCAAGCHCPCPREKVSVGCLSSDFVWESGRPCDSVSPSVNKPEHRFQATTPRKENNAMSIGGPEGMRAGRWNITQPGRGAKLWSLLQP
jgi:hypothetical protein